MANMQFYSSSTNLGRGRIIPYPIANSQTIRRGDWVVLVDGSPNVVRKLTSADIAANYTETAVIKGVLGMAMHDATTDANGYASGQINPTGVASNANAVYGLPTFASGIHADIPSGRALLNVCIADNFTDFIILVQAPANAAVTGTAVSNLVNEAVGLQVYNTIDFAVSTTSSTDRLLTITQFPLPNGLNNTLSTSSATMWYAAVRVLPGYQQFALGRVWTA
jgi:hypothetical protein